MGGSRGPSAVAQRHRALGGAQSARTHASKMPLGCGPTHRKAGRDKSSSTLV